LSRRLQPILVAPEHGEFVLTVGSLAAFLP
jgi:hypothetical protein